ncbi:hypothetical protein BJ965_004853 [Streptomyces luteogriseus]|uniref:Uncharacterized protein n=1 Tax=Streptomyces luteogriseus TaxID=68233 RepID=A0A7W7DQQ4_9ACTN|nr:hypothetical protein [Streptomyces luteogriseus]MBB4714971.1 hypothetical protein [Streptomyces luteogriseus]
MLAVVALAPAAYAADAGHVSVTPAAPAPGSDITLRVTGCAQRTAVAASAAFVADARLTVTGARELTGESRVRSTAEAGSYAVRVTCGATRQSGTLTVRDDEAGRSGSAPLPVPGPAGRPPAPDMDGRLPAPDMDGRLPAPDGGGGNPSAPGIDTAAPSAPGVDAGPSDPDGGGGNPSVPGSDTESSARGVDEEPSLSHRPGAWASPVAPVRAGGGGAAELVAAEERGAGPGTAQGVTGLVLAGVAAVVVALRGLRRGRGTD